MHAPAQDVVHSRLSGAFWINKPEGLTSSDVVVRLKKGLTEFGYFNRFPDGPTGEKKSLKIGHGGTLDPFATGVLVILIGEATKLADPYLHSVKSYAGIITLGSKTDSADLTGTVIDQKPIPSLSAAEWQALAESFTQDLYLQTPPMHSAKKLNGKPLYELAHQGIEVERKAILKKIHLFSVTPLSATELSFKVTCESGTYVRVIAEDLARKAGTIAHLKTLIRTQTSDATLEESMSMEKLFELFHQKTALEEIASYHGINEVATHLPQMQINSQTAQELKNGLVQVSHDLCAEAHLHHAKSRYVLVRNEELNIPVALLENQTEHQQFRLQRIIHA